ncbi:flagellar basal body rod protein FlgB [Paludibacterium yongneupense]|uniref:flagellar basal body rod protein FlgB n=1 Tax=Paludibacterium yongneupense TaxID=400061 RepID=UPI0004062603|nr:flagellar basal body rod protein FlgB [Paludibacterium yongneupense]
MLDKIAKDFDFNQRALDLGAYRSEVLASNMANAETPNYKAVDFDFGQAMKNALSASQHQSLGLTTTDPRHFGLKGSANADLGVKLQYRSAVQPSIDGNTVDMDVERGAFTDNSLQYQSTLTFLNHRISDLNSAIKGE